MSTSSSQLQMLVDEPHAEHCRTCNVFTTRYLPLHEPYTHADDTTTLATLLKDCANLETRQSENFLPQHMCEQCVELLLQLSEFKRTAQRTDVKLRKRFARARKQQKLQEDSVAAGAASTDEVASTDEYVYVLEESDGGSIDGELQLRFDSTSPKVELFEVDFEDEAEEQQQLPKMTANNVKQRSQHRRKSYNPALQCPMCGKQLSTSNSYKYHMQLHGEDRPFVCNICGESFKTRNAYDGHATLHNPNNPNKCRICGKTYRQASSLRSHLLSHSGVKPFTCDICGKGLTQKSGYKKHMLTHTGEKPHTCDNCGRSFRYSSNLIAHKRSHSRKVVGAAGCHQKEQLD